MRPIARTATATPASGPHRETHTTLLVMATNLDTCFITAGTMLAEVIDSLDQVTAEIEALTGALDAQAAQRSVTDLQVTAARLAALPESHARRAARMRDVEEAARDLDGEVAYLKRTLDILGIFGMNIGIASCGEPAFTGSVRHMTEKLTLGERDLAGMTAKLTELTTGVDVMRAADGRLQDQIRQIVPHVPERLARNATGLQAHRTESAAVAGQVAAAARRVRDQVGVMLGAMQVGDRVRQRLEHVVATLDIIEAARGDGQPAAVVRRLEQLVAAQIEATAADFDGDATLLASAFTALEPDTRELLRLMEDQMGTRGAGFLAELEESVADIVDLTTRLSLADRQAHAVSDLIVGAIADLNRRLDGVRRLRGNVQIIATNIALLCRRHGVVGRGVSAIADQIDIYAAELPQIAEKIAEPIGRLVAVSSAMKQEQDSAGQTDTGGMLSAALAVLHAGNARSERAIGGHADGSARVIDTIAAAATHLSEELGLAGEMRRAADRLADTPAIPLSTAEEAALIPLLAAIAPLYTMAQERAIHAGFVPAGVGRDTAAVPDDAEDDGLF